MPLPSPKPALRKPAAPGAPGGAAQGEGPTTKQYAMLGVCVAVLAIVLFRQFAGKSAGPATATGAGVAEATIATASGSRVRVPPVAAAAALVAHWRDTPIKPPTRNLFHNGSLAPEPAPLAAIDGGAESRIGSFWRGLDDAMDAQADKAAEATRHHAELLDGLAAVRVSSVVIGGEPSAIVNGAVLTVGDRFGPEASLRLVEIDARGVFAERAGRRVRLWLGNASPAELLAE